MKEKLSVEQIASVLRQTGVDVSVGELIRKVGDQRIDLLAREEAVRGDGDGSGPPNEATPGREQLAKACQTFIGDRYWSILIPKELLFPAQ